MNSLRSETPPARDDFGSASTKPARPAAARPAHRPQKLRATPSAAAENPSTIPPPLRPCSRVGGGCAPPRPTSAPRRSLFQDFEREALVHFHSCRAQQRAHRLGCAALPPNPFPKLFLMPAQFYNVSLRTLYA